LINFNKLPNGKRNTILLFILIKNKTLINLILLTVTFSNLSKENFFKKIIFLIIFVKPKA